MKIIIEDGLSLVQDRGVGKYTRVLYSILHSNYYVKMKRKYFLESIKNNIIRRICYGIWLNTVFFINTFQCKKNDICFFTSTMTPFFKLPWVRYYSVIHDTRSKDMPEISHKSYNINANFVNWTAVNFANKTITVSETMKNHIMKYYNIKAENIVVIYNSYGIQNVEDDENNKILERFKLKNQEYLFFVGGQDKHKNIKATVEAFEKINNINSQIKLVIAGNKGNDNISSTNPNIIFTGYLTDIDVKVLYKNALIYLFPSLYEGFGIPILEAQYCKVPVICSDIEVFREVAGDSVLFTKPEGEKIAEALQLLLNDSTLRNELIKKGEKNITRFSIDKIEKQIHSLIEN